MVRWIKTAYMICRQILIKNAFVIAGPERFFPDGFVYLKDGAVASSGRSSNCPMIRNATVIDACGRVVLPGFINPHMHLYGQFAKGMSVPRMASFRDILEKLWWKLDTALTEEDIYYSALLGLIESVRSGVTTVFDHHASYGSISGSLGLVADAFLKTGVRGSLCFEVSDRHGGKKRDEAVRENASFLESCRRHVKMNRRYPLRGMVGLHASMTLSDHTLAESRREMDSFGVGAHIHVAEDVDDRGAVRRLCNEGILRGGTIAAHCVHINRSDLDLLKRSGAFVVHNPQSNLNNAVGVAPFIDMHRKGIPVGIGTDGMSASIAGDVKLASVLHKITMSLRGGGRAAISAGFAETKRSVMEVNPAIASEMFGMRLGVLKKGAAADVIISDYIPQTPVTDLNLWAHMLYGVMNLPVRTTICAGKVLMKDFEMKTVDEEKIILGARKLAKRLWDRI